MWIVWLVSLYRLLAKMIIIGGKLGMIQSVDRLVWFHHPNYRNGVSHAKRLISDRNKASIYINTFLGYQSNYAHLHYFIYVLISMQSFILHTLTHILYGWKRFIYDIYYMPFRCSVLCLSHSAPSSCAVVLNVCVTFRIFGRQFRKWINNETHTQTHIVTLVLVDVRSLFVCKIYFCCIHIYICTWIAI